MSSTKVYQSFKLDPKAIKKTMKRVEAASSSKQGSSLPKYPGSNIVTSVDLEEYAENHPTNVEPVRDTQSQKKSHIESYIPQKEDYVDLAASQGARERQIQTQQSIQISEASRWECEYNLLSG